MTHLPPQVRAIALAAAAAGATACTDPAPPVHDGVLTVSQEQQSAWVRNFNPFLAPGLSRFPSRGGVHEPLLVFDTMTGEYVPWLATGYAWRDGGRTLVFTVREGVSWSDGRPMSASDVAFTFRLMREHRALDLDGVWEYLADVSADGAEVVFTFRRPFSPGLFYVAQQPIVPEHVWSHVADPVSFPNETPVATGPFTEVEVFRPQVYQLGRNRHYWQPGVPAVRSLRFPAYPGNDAANLALMSGEVDWAGNFVPAVDRVFVARDPDHHGYWFPPVAGTIMLYPNTTRAPLGDARVRKALSLAIDRALLVEVALYGYTRPADATGLSDAHRRWRDAEAAAADWVGFDPARAGRLLDEAGWRRGADGVRRGPDGAPLALEIGVVAGWSDWVRAAHVIARGLRDAGVDAHVRAHEFGAWFERLQRGEFDLSLGWTVVGPDPYSHYRALMSARTAAPVGQPSAVNWHRFGDARADALLAAFEATTDRAEQERLSAELQRLFAAEAPVIPLYPNPSWGAYSTRRFTGFPSADDPYAQLSPNSQPECLLVLTRLAPR